jgi:adenylate cyclase
MSETRKVAAILAADVVGYSRLAGAGEDRTLARLRALRSDLIDPTIALHHGRIVKLTGDGALVEFRSVVDAVRCAVEAGVRSCTRLRRQQQLDQLETGHAIHASATRSGHELYAEPTAA